MASLCFIRSMLYQIRFALEDSHLLQATFAFVAAHLVRTMAQYAAGSGISEIKCILAGFIMKGFLGFGTFFIKSLTLVCSSASAIVRVLIRYSPWSSPLAYLLAKKDRPCTLLAVLDPWLPDGPDAFLEVRVRNNSFLLLLLVSTPPSGKMREVITAASAAGVAVAFGSPIGGVLFSIEVTS